MWAAFMALRARTQVPSYSPKAVMPLPPGTVGAIRKRRLGRRMGPSPALARRVLIVEDNPDNRLALRTLLELWGYVVEEAQDGAGAIQVFLERRPEIALVDIGLPGLNHYEVGLPADRQLALAPALPRLHVRRDALRRRLLRAAQPLGHPRRAVGRLPRGPDERRGRLSRAVRRRASLGPAFAGWLHDLPLELHRTLSPAGGPLRRHAASPRGDVRAGARRAHHPDSHGPRDALPRSLPTACRRDQSPLPHLHRERP